MDVWEEDQLTCSIARPYLSWPRPDCAQCVMYQRLWIMIDLLFRPPLIRGTYSKLDPRGLPDVSKEFGPMAVLPRIGSTSGGGFLPLAICACSMTDCYGLLIELIASS